MSKLEALFIGNCQNNGLIQYLSLSEEFSKTYNIKQYANWELIDNNDSIPVNDIKNADLFIYQPLPPIHGCYSTDPTVENSIGYFVKNSCKKISYPYVYCSSLWPLIQAGYNDDRWFGGQVIDKLTSQGLEFKDVADLYFNNKIDWDYETRFIESMSILKNKEKLTDLKISDFIENNVKKIPLFLIPQHPTSVIFYELSNRILDNLGMQRVDISVIDTINDAGLPDSTYGDCTSGKIHDLGMFPMHDSLIKDNEFIYVKNYNEKSIDFYIERIKDYMISSKLIGDESLGYLR